MEERDILFMAAIVMAIRTARLESKLFQGVSSPLISSEVTTSLWIARRLCERAEWSRRDFLQAEEADAERKRRGPIIRSSTAD